MKRKHFTLLACAAAALPPAPAGAVSIVLDYTYNTSPFFPVGGTARATLAQAASDLAAALGSTPLGAMGTNSFTGTSGSSSANISWNLTITNPSTGGATVLSAPHLTPGFAAGEIRIFPGWRNLGGAVIGTATPGVGQIAGGGASAPDNPGLTAAVNNMVNLSDATMARGAGPVIGTTGGAFSIGANPAVSFTVEYGAFVGSLWLDSDTDNDTFTDSEATLGAAWNLGMGLPGPGQYDLYTTALHEMMHAIGFGSSVTWNGLSDLRIASDHLAAGTMSTRLSDGQSQEAVMTPSTVVGTRKELTAVDIEFLGKIGYNAVPEPAAAGLLALAGSLLLGKRRRS